MDIDKLVSGAVGDSLKSQDQNEKSPIFENQIEKRGRKNKNLTASHYAEFKADRKKFRDIKQDTKFNIERVNGEVVEVGSISEFKELYRLTCFNCLDKFKEDNEELAKKAPFLWYKRILLDIKQNTPKVTYKELEKCSAVWDVLTELMDYIGLYITYETFEKVTSIYKYQLENMAVLSPEYKAFCKKINIERDSALLNELQYNPYNQTNKIFVAKSHGIIEKTEPKTIEVNHNIRNYDSLPMYKGCEIEDHQP